MENLPNANKTQLKVFTMYDTITIAATIVHMYFDIYKLHSH